MAVTVIAGGASPVVIPAGPLGTSGAKGDPGSPGEGYATRTAMAARAAPALLDDVYLTEAGREGKFVIDNASSWTAAIAADTAQGLFVTSTADATKVYRRVFSGAVDPKWFGILSTNTGSVNLTNFNSMRSTLIARALSSTFYRTLEKVRFTDDATYNFSAALDLIDGSMDIEGVGPPTDSSGTEIKVAGDTIFRLQASDTIGETTRTPGQASDHSWIRNFRLTGDFAGTEAEHHGIEFRTRGNAENLIISNCAGDGIHANVTAGSGGSTQGNANGCHLTNIRCIGNRNNIFFSGNDSNNWTTRGLDLVNARRYNFWGASAFASVHINPQAENGGYAPGSPACVVSLSGNWYAARKNGTWSNSPSGTTADTADWYYVSAGAPNSGLNIPTWTSGGSFRDGGSYRCDTTNAVVVFVGAYIEGTQLAQIDPPALVLGGSISAINLRGVPQISSSAVGLYSSGGLDVVGNAKITGAQSDIGPQTGSPSVTYNFNYGNGTGDGKLNFQRPGVATDGYIWGFNGSFIISATGTLLLRNGSTNVCQLTTNGFGYSSGIGGFVVQATSRTTGVTINKPTGQIQLVSAAGSTSWQRVTVTNSCVAATDTIRMCQGLGTDAYQLHVVHVAAGSFDFIYATTGGTTTEQPVFNFTVIKGQNA